MKLAHCACVLTPERSPKCRKLEGMICDSEGGVTTTKHINANFGCHHMCVNFSALLFVLVGAVTVISPLELIRTKVQSKKFSYKELHRFVSMKVSEDGWISLWKGWAPTILRDVPFSGRTCLISSC